MLSASSSCSRFLADGLAVDEIRGALCVRSGSENSVAVVGQHFKPARDIGGVVFAGLKREFEIGAEKSRSEFGNEFFHRIALRAIAFAAEVTGKA